MDNKCPHCGHNLPKSATFCMHCFSIVAPKAAPRPKKQRKRKTARVTLSVCLILLTLSSVTAFALSRQPQLSVPDLQTEQSTADAAENAFTGNDDSSEENASQPESVLSPGTETDLTDSTAASASASAPAEQPTAPSSAAPSAAAPAGTSRTAGTTITPTAPNTTAAAEVIINNGILTAYPADKTDRAYTIPYSVTAISGNAFHNSYLQTLTFSKREHLNCDWENLFAGLPNLKTIYIYAGTDADTVGMHYFDGEIIYYCD